MKSDRFKESEKWISHLLNSDDESKNNTNLKVFFDYLKKELVKQLILTGTEDFDWEEKYVLGGWDPREYALLKKTKPSFTDHFEYIQLDEKIDSWHGIFIQVKRISDSKSFKIKLWDLKSIESRINNSKAIDFYGIWMTNY